MNVPNQLSVARLVLCALFVLVMSTDWPYAATAGLALFTLASITDWLDGDIARRFGLITDLGKLLDPLADKVLISAAFISMVEQGLAPMWMVVTIISREFLITGLRVIAANKNHLLAAERAGKHKTVTQMLTLLASLGYLSLQEFGRLYSPLGYVLEFILMPLYWLALIVTVISGLLYFYKNRSLFFEDPLASPKEVATFKKEDKVTFTPKSLFSWPIQDPNVGTVQTVHASMESEMPSTPVCTHQPAFKEWNVMVEALGAGAQIFILRKGGLAEGREGFQACHQRFWLFPTLYHEQLTKTKPSAHSFALPQNSKEEPLSLHYFAELTDARFLDSWEEVARLDSSHFWKEEAIRERFEWSSPPGIHLLVLRIYRSSLIHHLDSDPSFKGCKSWIEVPVDFDLGEASPVISDEEFATRRSQLLASLPERAKPVAP